MYDPSRATGAVLVEEKVGLQFVGVGGVEGIAIEVTVSPIPEYLFIDKGLSRETAIGGGQYLAGRIGDDVGDATETLFDYGTGWFCSDEAAV